MLYSDIADEMALKKDIADEIRNAVREAFGEHTRAKLTRFKSWSPLGAAIAISLFILSQWNTYTVFRTHTEDRLETIEGTLRTIQASQQPRKVLNEIASLPKRAFAASLPALKIISDQLPSEVNPTVPVVKEITTKLRDVRPTEQDYWPITLKFINFATSAITQDVPPPGSTVNSYVSDIHNLGPFMHEVISLDSGTIEGVRFENCRIIFTTQPVTLRRVTFINCVFEFPIQQQEPAEFIQTISRDILLSNLSTIYMQAVG